MSFAQERELIETHFQTNWNILDNDIPVTFDEHGSKPNKDELSVRLSIGSGRSEQISVGDPNNNLQRSAGVILIQLFAPAGKGSKAMRELADMVEPIFKNKTLGNILTRIPSVVNRQTDTSFLIWTISISYQRDETTA